MKKLLLIVLSILLPRLGAAQTSVFRYDGAKFTACLGSDITDTTSTTVAAAGGAGIIRYITSWTVSNMSASVSTRVDLLDGTTVIDTCPAAAGGGCKSPYFEPLKGTANTAIKCQAATTSAAVRCCVSGFTATR